MAKYLYLLFFINCAYSQDILRLKKGDNFTTNALWISQKQNNANISLVVKYKVIDLDSVGNYLIEGKLVDFLVQDNNNIYDDFVKFKNISFNMLMKKNYTIEVLDDKEIIPHIVTGLTCPPLFFPNTEVKKNRKWTFTNDIYVMNYKVDKMTHKEIIIISDGKFLDSSRSYRIVLDRKTGLIKESKMIGDKEQQKVEQRLN